MTDLQNGKEPQNGNHISNGVKSEEWEEVVIPVPWGKVAGKWWGSRRKQPVLALHGWQDNAGTFDKLIPLLAKDISFLAIDLPGHGKSSHYPPGMQYYLFWDGVALIRRIVKHFKWEKVALMGHSLGGALSFIYAASFPDEVSKLISLDIAGPTVRDQKSLASATGGCIDKFLEYEHLKIENMPCYGYQEMIDLVVDAYDGSVDEAGVKILMKRGMAPLPKEAKKSGYCFARDVRLKVSIMGMFTTEQVLSYAERIKCQVLNIRAEPGMKFHKPEVYEMVIEAMRGSAEFVIFKKVPGTHHVHLVNPERIASDIDDFLHEMI